MIACLAGLDPAAYKPHALHGADRNWPETNCYVDLWIEALSARGLEPRAAFGFTVLQDFEGDQFTFFKIPPEDLMSLYDVRVQELAIYDTVERHALTQLRRGRLVLAEVDSFYLPDTRGLSYRKTHGKTTIGINAIDAGARLLHYFHNGGYYALDDADFDGLFRADVTQSTSLAPYVEFVKLGAVAHPDLHEKAATILRTHLQQRPQKNPIRAYREVVGEHLSQVGAQPMEYFHLYAFNVLRQLGANFELLESHLEWLTYNGETGLRKARDAALGIATSAKSAQFQFARAVARKQFLAVDASLASLEQNYDHVMDELVSRY